MNIKTLQAMCATTQLHERLDIVFDEDSGLIVSVNKAGKKESEVDYFYDNNCLLFAGMGDIHIHAREDFTQKNVYKEDFTSTCCAALNGGIVHVADMPNNPKAPVDDESYLEKLELTKKSEIPILLYAGIGPETRPLSFLVPYKVYMGPSIGELYFKDNQSLDGVLKYYKNQYVSFHCEDPEILEGHKSEASHELKRPVSAEIMATQTALHLIEKYQLKGKLCHYSAGAGLKAIKEAKMQGLSVTCEVTPQHLYFSSESLKKKSDVDQTFYQMNPPIRSESNRLALMDALNSGLIDFLATDHAPHSLAEKHQGMSGLPGLDTYGAFVTWLILNQGVSVHVIAKVVSENPGAFLNQFISELSSRFEKFPNLGQGMGFLLPGYSASFSILNLSKPIEIKHSDLKTKAQWSPFLGESFPGSVEHVFYRGKLKSKECKNLLEMTD